LYQNSSHVLCLDNLKQAALYFDRVVPIQFFRMQGRPEGSFVEVPERIPTTAIAELIYGKGTPEHKILHFLDKDWMPFNRRVGKEFGFQNDNPDFWKDIYQSNPISKNNVKARDLFLEFAKTLGIDKPSILIPEHQSNGGFEEAYLSLSLDSIPLIDPSNASWEQIMEFRYDDDSVNKLRNLRLYIFENYLGKPQAYIQDQLSKKLDDYEYASKKHGFDLTTSVLTTVLDSKNLQASLTAGIGAAFFGGVELAIGAACAVEIGKGSIELAKKMYSFKELKNNHDVAYLIKAKEKLQSNANKSLKQDK
jgi:hypothetical protein